MFITYYRINNLRIILFSASERVTRDPEVSLVSRVRNLRPGDLHQAEGPQGDVGRQDHEEQDHQLRAQVRQ